MNVRLRTTGFDERLLPSIRKVSAEPREPRLDWRAAAGLIAAGVLNLIWIGFLVWLAGETFGAW